MRNALITAVCTIVFLAVLEFAGLPALSWLTTAVNWTRTVLTGAADTVTG